MAMERHCLFSDVSQTDSGVHPDFYSMTIEGTFCESAAVREWNCPLTCIQCQL